MPELNICLALSGGGFRATIFHLGLIRFLRDTQLNDGSCLLSKVTNICSVSGGSVVAAYLINNWAAFSSGDPLEFDAASTKLIDLVSSDMRGHIVRRLPYRHLVHSWKRATYFTSCLRQLYQNKSPGKGISKPPKLHILATNVTTGTLWSFEDDALTIHSHKEDHRIAVNVPISQKVMPSAAFPGFFPPVKFTNHDLGVPTSEFQPLEQFLTDGGIFDNLGVRKAKMLMDKSVADGHPFSLVILSDAGGTLDISSATHPGIIGTTLRSIEILMDRLGRVDLEVIGLRDTRSPGDSLPGVYRLASIKTELFYNAELGVLPCEIQREVKRIRTDLDRFSNVEIACIVQQGYSVARNLFTTLLESRDTHAPGDVDYEAIQREIKEIPKGKPWLPPGISPPYASTGADDVQKCMKTIQQSSRRRWGLFDAGDAMSYVNVLLIALIIFAVGFLGYCGRSAFVPYEPVRPHTIPTTAR